MIQNGMCYADSRTPVLKIVITAVAIVAVVIVYILSEMADEKRFWSLSSAIASIGRMDW